MYVREKTRKQILGNVLEVDKSGNVVFIYVPGSFHEDVKGHSFLAKFAENGKQGDIQALENVYVLPGFYLVVTVVAKLSSTMRYSLDHLLL